MLMQLVSGLFELLLNKNYINESFIKAFFGGGDMGFIPMVEYTNVVVFFIYK